MFVSLSTVFFEAEQFRRNLAPI